MSGSFYQLPETIAGRGDLSSTDKIVYAVIVDGLRRGKPVGTWRLARLTGTTLPTVREAIQQLQRLRLLVVTNNGNGRRRTYSIPDATGKGSCTGKDSIPVRDVARSPVKDLARKPVKTLSPHTETEITENNPVDAAASPASTAQGDLLPDDTPGPKPARKRAGKGKPDTDPRVAPTLAHFSERFESVHGRKPLIRGSKDGALIRALPEHVSVDQIRAAVDAMLADKWGRPNASIGVLVGQWDKWLNARAGANGTAAAPSDEPAYYRPAREVLPT